MLLRDLGDGTTEIVTLSRWISIEAIKAFAGADRTAPATSSRSPGAAQNLRKLAKLLPNALEFRPA
ncbi:hypothetical protein [Bosea sp. (in: a-proteobacteria)]|uniref:hypothetical protein n=1 Tax=Bosea sp. (in: a-proteobacteria) TaxID=1871050 RepID=UPI003B3BBA2C